MSERAQPAAAQVARSASAPPGRPKDLEKRAAILDAAKVLFVEHGYDGTSMDAIAQRAGVSKLTVYSHFQDKDSLFVAAVKARCEEQLPPDLFLADQASRAAAAGRASPHSGRGREASERSGPLRTQLIKIAQACFALITSDEAIAIHRVMARQLPVGSKLPMLFWEAGPKRIQDAFAEFLRAETAAGQLDVADTQLAASQFLCLLKGDHHARLLCGCHEPYPDADNDRHIEATVGLFLRAYGPRGA